MQTLKIRQGVVVGIVISLILAAAIAGRSSNPLPTFGYVLGVALLMVTLTIGGLVVVNRRERSSKGR